MKNLKQRFSGWQSNIKEKCDNLSHKQRIRFILIISALYLLMAIGTFSWIYLGAGKERKFNILPIQNPIPVLKKSLGLDTEKDSIQANPQIKKNGTR